MNMLTRFAPDLELAKTSDGRTVCGLICPFDSVAMVDDGAGPYKESFRFGAFAKTIAERGDKVKFLSHHNKSVNPLGRASLLREDTAGVWGEFYVSKTQAGDEALELVKDGVLDSFSVGFAPIRAARNTATGVLERTEVALRETSLVTFPAYTGAQVASIREETASGLLIADAMARLEAI